MGTGLFCVVILFVIGYGYCSKEWGTDYVEVTEPPITQNFYFSKTGESYYEALHTCIEKSMQLVSIDSAKKNRELAKIIKDSGGLHRYWTSGNNIAKGRWSWSKGEPIDYFNWNPDLPTPPSEESYYYNVHQECIKIAKNEDKLYWERGFCHEKNLYICEKTLKVSKSDCVATENLVQGDSQSHFKYYIAEERVTYPKAIDVCRSMCMELVSIESKQKNQDVSQAFVNANVTDTFWSSGQRRKRFGAWKWINGETVNFFSWDSGEPNNKGVKQNKDNSAESTKSETWGVTTSKN
ncbi:macrophage mannose receptor 1-like isoform X2 [Diabrotica virgifera virgifera]|uniref:C-type lectin domain-containing protein n=1 Tax=Diabrotica virgifera virgifera TaxID=50390 RepID=A0ABM5KHT9_DIAVI|nr:macrophage mannose receptor 1-like isoform X2 [Diabrotica virgifera virgifera]